MDTLSSPHSQHLAQWWAPQKVSEHYFPARVLAQLVQEERVFLIRTQGDLADWSSHNRCWYVTVWWWCSLLFRFYTKVSTVNVSAPLFQLFLRERLFLFRCSQDFIPAASVTLAKPLFFLAQPAVVRAVNTVTGPTFSAMLWMKENCLSQGCGLPA